MKADLRRANPAKATPRLEFPYRTVFHRAVIPVACVHAAGKRFAYLVETRSLFL